MFYLCAFVFLVWDILTDIQITRDGVTYTSLGMGPNGHPVWPIDEYLSRTDFPPDIAVRVREMNPDGIEEGCLYDAILGATIDEHFLARCRYEQRVDPPVGHHIARAMK